MTYVIRVEKALTLPAGFNLIPHPVEYVDWADIDDGDFSCCTKQENARKFADWELQEILDHMNKLTTCNRSFRFWAVKYNPAPVFVKDDRYHLDIFANVVSLYSPETMNADFLFIGKMFVDLDNKIMTIKLVRRAADQCGLLEAKLF